MASRNVKSTPFVVDLLVLAAVWLDLVRMSLLPENDSEIKSFDLFMILGISLIWCLGARDQAGVAHCESISASLEKGPGQRCGLVEAHASGYGLRGA
uniref:Uncharacterized protein n=1 Tax=Peronospora matthiolae TaxID=2874970 RepID=A0AAV1TEG7_9STRA